MHGVSMKYMSKATMKNNNLRRKSNAQHNHRLQSRINVVAADVKTDLKSIPHTPTNFCPRVQISVELVD